MRENATELFGSRQGLCRVAGIACGEQIIGRKLSVGDVGASNRAFEIVTGRERTYSAHHVLIAAIRDFTPRIFITRVRL